MQPPPREVRGEVDDYERGAVATKAKKAHDCLEKRPYP